jgi:UPF0042 nucleotide-binding protein
LKHRHSSGEKAADEGGSGRKSRVVIITGLSGSGKTVALRAIEDLQFFCVDNLPVSLIDALVTKVSSNKAVWDVAIGVDIREKEFLHDVEKTLESLRAGHRVEVLFLEAETDVLLRRFKETRRPHPLGGDIEDAIRSERESLTVLRDNADRVIDTTSFSPHQLRKLISTLYFPGSGHKDITITLVSFGFKYGVPHNIDLLFDVRFLPNPYFVPSLRDLNGTDSPVARFVFSQDETARFMEKIEDLLGFLVPLYIREGKSYLSIAIGCTGGNHRSPAIVEELGKFLRSDRADLNIIHRDMS